MSQSLSIYCGLHSTQWLTSEPGSCDILLDMSRVFENDGVEVGDGVEAGGDKDIVDCLLLSPLLDCY